MSSSELAVAGFQKAPSNLPYFDLSDDWAESYVVVFINTVMKIIPYRGECFVGSLTFYMKTLGKREPGMYEQFFAYLLGLQHAGIMSVDAYLEVLKLAEVGRREGWL